MKPGIYTQKKFPSKEREFVPLDDELNVVVVFEDGAKVQLIFDGKALGLWNTYPVSRRIMAQSTGATNLLQVVVTDTRLGFEVADLREKLSAVAELVKDGRQER